jgi:hypothetical protein
MRGSAMVWLEEKFRAEMNDLVDKLNQVIARAVSDTNARRGAHQVHYVDVAHSFNNGHRWCENPNGEFHEPQESRDDTWFFLSAWHDFGIESGLSVSLTTFPLLFLTFFIMYGRRTCP